MAPECFGFRMMVLANIIGMNPPEYTALVADIRETTNVALDAVRFACKILQCSLESTPGVSQKFNFYPIKSKKGEDHPCSTQDQSIISVEISNTSARKLKIVHSIGWLYHQGKRNRPSGRCIVLRIG
jgi:hypothetical protein